MTENSDSERKKAAADHLDDLPEGSGCAEIWAHLSEKRDEGTDTAE